MVKHFGFWSFNLAFQWFLLIFLQLSFHELLLIFLINYLKIYFCVFFISPILIWARCLEICFSSSSGDMFYVVLFHIYHKIYLLFYLYWSIMGGLFFRHVKLIIDIGLFKLVLIFFDIFHFQDWSEILLFYCSFIF